MEGTTQGPLLHLAFGLRIACASPIPELETTGGGPVDLEIRWAPPAPPPDPPPGTPGFLPLLYDDPAAPWASVRRVPGGFDVRFHRVADFHLREEGRQVACIPVPGVPPETVRHMLLDNLLPCLLAHRGRLVFHGSAAAVPSGAAVFVGYSGVGKSTLAAAFAQRTGRYLGDDTAVLDPAPGGFRVIPAYPNARLHPEQAEALGFPPASTAVAHNTRKRRFEAAGMGASVPRESLPLRRIYLLPDAPGGSLSIGEVPGPDALIQLLDNSYRLDPEDRGRLAEVFGILSRPDLLDRVRRVRINRWFDLLPSVLDAIESDCR